MLGRHQNSVTKPERMSLAQFSRTLYLLDQQSRLIRSARFLSVSQRSWTKRRGRTTLLEQSPQLTAHLGLSIGRKRVYPDFSRPIRPYVFLFDRTRSIGLDCCAGFANAAEGGLRSVHSQARS
jgi:hypothetical protein